tara:strand:- start:446 stop:1183 length:738 start_codon:yes stop_codon:yes gene_type:complete
MAELTYDPTPAEQGEFNESELEALKVGEAQANSESQMLAGKFENAEALEKAYLELQSKLGETKEEPEPEPEAEKKEEVDESIFQSMREEMESGEISEETWAKIDEMNPRELVESYMKWDGEQTQDLTEAQVTSIKNSVGGEKAYSDLMEWSSKNLPEQYVAAFDDLVASGDVAAIELAVSGLVASYQNKNGYEGRMVTGRDAVNKAEVFRSQAEVVQAMSDPRYDRDPAYRQDVFDKLERSDLQY